LTAESGGTPLNSHACMALKSDFRGYRKFIKYKTDFCKSKPGTLITDLSQTKQRGLTILLSIEQVTANLAGKVKYEEAS